MLHNANVYFKKSFLKVYSLNVTVQYDMFLGFINFIKKNNEQKPKENEQYTTDTWYILLVDFESII